MVVTEGEPLSELQGLSEAAGNDEQVRWERCQEKLLPACSFTG